MQTLWSRVAQVRGSCHCPQCLSAANGVSRRATATATRRMPRYLTSSTLWYSGIFAAAATFDAGAKKQRREQWDRAIAEVKEELELPANATKGEVLGGIEFGQDLFQAAQTAFKPFGASSEAGDVFQHVEPLKSKPHWPTNTGPALKLNHLPPESVYATDSRKRRGESLALGPKKLAEVQLSVEILLLELFMELQRRGWSDEAAQTVPKDFAQNILRDSSVHSRSLVSKKKTLRNLEEAKSDLSDWQFPDHRSIKLCNFGQDHLEYAKSNVRDMNSSLLELFRLQADEKLSRPSLLAKLAYNLSLCSGPPNLKTYNILLLGFSAMREPTLFEKTLKSSARAVMRPNEVTLAAVLKHYTNTSQPEKFVRWIEMMRGRHGGLALARSDINITESGQKRLLRKPGNPDKIIQLPYATPFVFEPLIAGVIKFAGFKTALEICQTMGMEGWGLCMSGLTPLLQDCAQRADWTSGLAVWSQIQALKAISRRKQRSRWMTERIKIDTFAAMLRLCSRCNKKEYFESVWDQAAKVHHNSIEKLVRLVKGSTEVELASEARQVEAGSSQTLPHLTSSESNASLANSHDIGEIPLELEMLDPAPSTKFQRQGDAAGKVVGEVRSTPEHLQQDSSLLPLKNSSQDYEYRPFREKARLRHPSLPTRGSELLEEQLFGFLPPSDELSNYELQERPMAISA